jgi:hypothetical protein
MLIAQFKQNHDLYNIRAEACKWQQHDLTVFRAYLVDSTYKAGEVLHSAHSTLHDVFKSFEDCELLNERTRLTD